MTIDILRRTGGWCIELQYPLKHHTGDVTAIEIRPPTADVVIRWGADEIPSLLAMLSELCDLPEKLIRQLPASDFDRVMFAFTNMLPATIKQSMETSLKPLATPEEMLPMSEQVPPPDQLDPRFPATTGPVQRLMPKPPPPPENDEEPLPPLDFAPPRVTEAVR